MVDPIPDDSLRGEAQARDEATLMPWLWGAAGFGLIAVFVAFMLSSGGHHIRHPAAAAPTINSGH